MSSLKQARASLPAALKVCARSSLSGPGRALHSRAIKLAVSADSFVLSALISFYSRTGDLGSARLAFSSAQTHDPVACNALISAFSSAGVTASARRLFDEMPHRTTASWNAVMACYARNGDPAEGLKLFDRMLSQRVPLTAPTLVTALCLCAKLGDLARGSAVAGLVRARGLDKDLVVRTAVLEMYVKCGAVDRARGEFDAMASRDVVAWSAMVAGYAQNGRPEEALGLFEEMRAAGVEPNEVTIVSALSAAAQLGPTGPGSALADYVESSGLARGVFVGSALVDMSFKCGDLDRARRAFARMPVKDAAAWNSMIAGLGFHGLAQQALDTFDRMQRAGAQPNEITFVGLLAGCAHGGLVGPGLALFRSMDDRHGLKPRLEHVACVVDLLCKAGRVEEAFGLVDRTAVRPNAVVWGTLLGACRARSAVRLAEVCAEKLLALEPDNSANYVALSNVYAGSGKWAEAWAARRPMKAHKTAACSWVHVGESVHVFLVGDTSHPRADDIHDVARGLARHVSIVAPPSVSL